MPTRYYITLPDAARARGPEPALSFTAQGAEAFAEQLQDDPDDVDPTFGATDPGATVVGRQDDLHIDLVVTTSIPGDVLKQRLRMLAGSHWNLRDVTAA